MKKGRTELHCHWRCPCQWLQQNWIWKRAGSKATAGRHFWLSLWNTNNKFTEQRLRDTWNLNQFCRNWPSSRQDPLTQTRSSTFSPWPHPTLFHHSPNLQNHQKLLYKWHLHLCRPQRLSCFPQQHHSQIQHGDRCHQACEDAVRLSRQVQSQACSRVDCSRLSWRTFWEDGRSKEDYRAVLQAVSEERGCMVGSF